MSKHNKQKQKPGTAQKPVTQARPSAAVTPQPAPAQSTTAAQPATAATPATPPRETLEQQRAAFAWACANEGTQTAGEEYRNLAKAAPALIMNNGLMQTLAFYQDKNKSHHALLAKHLRQWVFQRAGGSKQDPGFNPLMEGLIKATPAQYRQATDEALLILRWIRQFAAAL